MQMVTVTCNPVPTQFVETEAVRQVRCPAENTERDRPIRRMEKNFQVILEYIGGGCGGNSMDMMIYRTGVGRFTLIKGEDEADQDCLFGTYRHLISPDAFTTGWFTAGGANPAPYYDPANPGDALYYVGELNSAQGNTDCANPIWHRNRNFFGCKYEAPEVYIF